MFLTLRLLYHSAFLSSFLQEILNNYGGCKKNLCASSKLGLVVSSKITWYSFILL